MIVEAEQNISPSLRERQIGLGAAFAEVAGGEVARHYGDSAAEYRAVRQGAGVAERSDQARIRLWGTDPVKMVQGLITNDLAGAPADRTVYAAMLTPKGRMLTDLVRPRYVGSNDPDGSLGSNRIDVTGDSFTKGCYTGQETIVRIAHRGHANRHLRGLLLGDAAVPGYRTPLLHIENGKEIGWTTSATESPLAGQTIALCYLRREIGPGDRVKTGDAGEATVSALPFQAR